MATINGIQLHYVMGGKEEPVGLLHGYPQSVVRMATCYAGLVKNYTVVAPIFEVLVILQNH